MTYIYIYGWKCGTFMGHVWDLSGQFMGNTLVDVGNIYG